MPNGEINKMNYSEVCIPSMRCAVDASATGATTQTTLLILVAKAILTACDSSLYTCTASVSGATSVDLQLLLEVLHTCGYSTSIATTTLTVTWS